MHPYNQNAAGIALLGATIIPAQFAVDAGQLEHHLPRGGFLYGIVEARADATVAKLKLSFSTSPATTGAFPWSGDVLTRTISMITRPNAAAWLTCDDAEGRVLYVNLGEFSYLTIVGCF